MTVAQQWIVMNTKITDWSRALPDLFQLFSSAPKLKDIEDRTTLINSKAFIVWTQ